MIIMTQNPAKYKSSNVSAFYKLSVIFAESTFEYWSAHVYMSARLLIVSIFDWSFTLSSMIQLVYVKNTKANQTLIPRYDPRSTFVLPSSPYLLSSHQILSARIIATSSMNSKNPPKYAMIAILPSQSIVVEKLSQPSYLVLPYHSHCKLHPTVGRTQGQSILFFLASTAQSSTASSFSSQIYDALLSFRSSNAPLSFIISHSEIENESNCLKRGSYVTLVLISG